MFDAGARIGLSEREVMDLTPQQFHRRLRVKNEEAKERKHLEKEKWRRTAWVCATIINHGGMGREKKDMVEPEDLLVDPDKPPPEGTVSEQKERIKRKFRLEERGLI